MNNKHMKISEIVTIEPCRDGGSMIAQFRDQNDVHHCLELRVILVNDGKDFKIKGYQAPVLITYNPSIYESTVTGIRTPKFETTEECLNWQQAKILLEEIKPLIVPGANQRLDIFDSMLSITENEGKYYS